MPYTLLLADDSVTIQRVIELTFADEDITVVAVSDGDQAIARLESSSPPDIVLADIGMPGKNGYEVAKYIKQAPKLSHIPVVLLTGAFEPVDQARATEAGCDGVLAKPFEPQLVIGRVKELLARSRPVPASLDDQLAPPTAMGADRWSAPGVDEAFATKPAAGDAAAPLDDYFDRLDEAFQTLAGPASVPSVGVAPAAKPAAATAETAPDIDWFGPRNDSWDLPAPSDALATVSHARLASPVATHEETSGVVTPAPAAPAPHPVAPPEPARIVALPPLADAFAAILASEQSEVPPSAPPHWPATGMSTDELTEQVTRRVLDQLSDRVVRDTVTEVAERLVREEIERIKASIK